MPASSSLVELTKDEHPTVRREAINVLPKIKYEGPDYIVQLETIAASDSNIFNQKAAKEILQSIQNGH
ncbi:HEAT repeat domain-containing protein [Pelobacter seleniigenes]|uniref:HEAT repeat domain-containing protein n=1 Tax=Pelobacter seleniigenes TaxID=407188 RepID=UPI0004A7535F|nr:HEAT repeat domain-containing protein [Pelobacter seleniigenes]